MAVAVVHPGTRRRIGHPFVPIDDERIMVHADRQLDLTGPFAGRQAMERNPLGPPLEEIPGHRNGRGIGSLESEAYGAERGRWFGLGSR